MERSYRTKPMKNRAIRTARDEARRLERDRLDRERMEEYRAELTVDAMIRARNEEAHDAHVPQAD